MNTVAMFLSLLLNTIIIGCELWVLAGLRKKTDIVRYYTYLQNALGLVSSILFVGALLLHIFCGTSIPEYAKGFRYIATTGLTVTFFVYCLILSPGHNHRNLISEDDFKQGYDHIKANHILHGVCPALSLISFICFERQFPLHTPVWTGMAAIPSCIYWGVYIVLSVNHLWTEPYDFSTSTGKRSPLKEALCFILIPALFIVTSIILWNIK